MAYSEILADRIRQALAPLPSVKEQKMFGGIAFMLKGLLPSQKRIQKEEGILRLSS